MKSGLKIIGLKASNVMNLEVVEIVPDGDVVILSGKNAAGKTNILKSIEFALSGKALKAATEPVRRGQESGDIVLDLGDIVIKRHFTNDSSSLVVENSEGMIYKTPQALIDGFRGKISFDIMGFSRLPEKQQKEILLGLIDLPIDLDELEGQRKEIYNNRTLNNRDVKQLEGQLAGIPDLPDVPDDEVSAVDVMADMQAANDQITANNTVRGELTAEINHNGTIRVEQERINAEILKLQDNAEFIKIDLSTSNQTIATMKDTVAELVDPDLEQFKCEVEDVEKINVLVRKKQERRRIQTKLTDARGVSLGMTADITAIDELKSKTIQEANMPVPGLGFDGNGVTFEDIPLSQRSDGEKRKISMAIGMALNPDLRVLWVPDASLLDSDSMDDVETMARENGFQVWLERVEDTENVAIHIKEGKVVS